MRQAFGEVCKVTRLLSIVRPIVWMTELLLVAIFNVAGVRAVGG
jgi:hypothetical protein